MAKKTTSKVEPVNKKPASLLMSKAEASERIKRQIEKGYELKNLPINSNPELQEAKDEKGKWKSFTYELLTRMFDDIAIADEFQRADRKMVIGMGEHLFTSFWTNIKGTCRKALTH